MPGALSRVAFLAKLGPHYATLNIVHHRHRGIHSIFIRKIIVYITAALRCRAAAAPANLFQPISERGRHTRAMEGSASPCWMLDLLNGEELPIIEGVLDADTLTAVCDALPQQSAAAGAKRLSGTMGFCKDDECSGEDSEDEGGGPMTKKTKQTARSKSKASKEKERRSKINERWVIGGGSRK